jgi:F-type H+-transporting ATPase subunit a
MTAGHVVILSMLGLIFLLKSWLVVPVSIGFALFIFLLEILIAFIQAYIFSVLTAVFIQLSRHPH